MVLSCLGKPPLRQQSDLSVVPMLTDQPSIGALLLPSSSSYKMGHCFASLLILTVSPHKLNNQTSPSVILSYYSITMSDKCGNCDCADKSQCVKKGSAYVVDIVETETSHFVMDAEAAEHDGKCKCGISCTCTDCTCGQ